MSLNRPPNPLPESAHALIQRKVRQIIRRRLAHPQDAEDLKQELYQRLCRRLANSRTDPALLEQCLPALVYRSAANLLRDQQAWKRRHGPPASLDAPIRLGEGEPTEPAQILSAEVEQNRRGRYAPADQLRCELALDVASFIARLPEAMQPLARLLGSESIREIARRLGIPRTTLYERIRAVRKALKRADFENS